MGMGFKFQMGMGMKSLKWEGIGTKNLFPHTSSMYRPVEAVRVDAALGCQVSGAAGDEPRGAPCQLARLLARRHLAEPDVALDHLAGGRARHERQTHLHGDHTHTHTHY